MGKIKKLQLEELTILGKKYWAAPESLELCRKINEVIDAVNGLTGE